MTEEHALALLQKRDTAGLVWFMERYTAYVSTIVWNILGRRMTEQDAEEVTSDVFLALWENGRKPQAGRVRGYLGSIARTRAINRLRGSGLALELDDDVLSLPADWPEQRLLQSERTRLVREAVDGLPLRDREIFIRHYYQCQTAAGIAEELGMSPDAVRQRLKRGRERLREQLVEGGIVSGISDI